MNDAPIPRGTPWHLRSTPIKAVDVVHERLRAHGLVAPLHARPRDVVASLCAVQAQDYRGGLWGIGLRTRDATARDVEDAIAAREIVRTWPMRGTLHFVAADDVRWMLALLGPRALARCASRSRALGIDDAALRKSRTILERTIGGGRALTRVEAYAALERGNVATKEQRGLHILIVLAMMGVVCFGERRERQPTFVLLDEWVAPLGERRRTRDPDDALGELARRYFTSHGPATLADFSWWSGASITAARRGIAVAGASLVRRSEDVEMWSGPPAPTIPRAASAHLLPAWDEYTVAYRDRTAILDPRHAKQARNGIFLPVVAVNGRITGLWKRDVKTKPIRVDVTPFHPGAHDSRTTRTAIGRAIARYEAFLRNARNG